MANIQEIGNTLQTSTNLAHEGLGILEVARGANKERVGLYSSVITALGEIAATLQNIKDGVDVAKGQMVEGAGKLHEAGTTLETLDTDHPNITGAGRQFHLAGVEIAAGGHASMNAALRNEQEELDSAIATVAALSGKLTIPRAFADSGAFVDSARGFVDTGVNLVQEYAAGASIPLPT